MVIECSVLKFKISKKNKAIICVWMMAPKAPVMLY